MNYESSMMGIPPRQSFTDSMPAFELVDTTANGRFVDAEFIGHDSPWQNIFALLVEVLGCEHIDVSQMWREYCFPNRLLRSLWGGTVYDEFLACSHFLSSPTHTATAATPFV
jgi:hypothetical protein